MASIYVGLRPVGKFKKTVMNRLLWILKRIKKALS